MRRVEMRNLNLCLKVEIVKLVKSIYENKKSNRELGKKAYKGDEEIMKTAERLLNEEFAIILNISPDEVNSYIAEKMSQ